MLPLARWAGVATACATLAACAPASPPQVPLTAPPVPCHDLPAGAAGGAPSAMRDLEQAKDRVFAAISANDGDGLFRLYDKPMQEAAPRDATIAFVQGLVASRGYWHKATREPGPPSTTLGAWLVLADRGTWRLEITLDPEGLIAGLLVTTPQRGGTPPVARNDVPMGLPFRGEWRVVWGGDSLELNHHVPVPDQRRAADLTVVGADHRTYRTDGRTNEDYYVFGQEVLAVADGTVETVVDGVPENVPHEENHYVIPGNFVLVRHGPALFSGYMHLQPGKMRVAPGQRVTRGTVLGLAGNTGNSTEPHLHFQLQDGPDGNKAWGIEPIFDRVVVTRVGRVDTVAGYEFLRGDLIRAP
jgi:hypothetical protein